MSNHDETLEALDAELDKELLAQVKGGMIVKDDAGKAVKLSTPAAVLNVARQRLRDLGYSKKVLPGTSAAEMADELDLKAVQLPPLERTA